MPDPAQLRPDVSLPPSSILIIGSGVFGLSTALALATRPTFESTTITLLDRSPFPAPDGSSIDSSRIIRADYSDPAYAALAAAAQAVWRRNPTSSAALGGSGRYSESGLVLVADKEGPGLGYVRKSFENVRAEHEACGDFEAVQELTSRKEIDAMVGTGGGSGDWGYVNRRSGWADAEASMRWLRHKAEETRRIRFVTDTASRLLYSAPDTQTGRRRVLGTKLATGGTLKADLTILAAGAWSASLVDLRGRCQSTGQVLSYLPITDQEQQQLGTMPVLLNMSTGFFIIPPRNNVLKVARHAYGYSNPTTIPRPEDADVDEEDARSAGRSIATSYTITTSLPLTTWDTPSLRAPLLAEAECNDALAAMIPSLASRPFTHSRLCWYTDTPSGDFLIDYHPAYDTSLFLATGGSGHGFKFLPVIGERIVDCVEGKAELPEPGLREKWRWRRERVDVVVTRDGSRGGEMGLSLAGEVGRKNVSVA